VSLLEALREDLGVRSVKDGCSPQGQCGCCTVLVDGAARAACVTPLRRVSGHRVTTVEGLDQHTKDRLVGAFVAQGASQCGFCTPGILCRLAPLGPSPEPSQVETALLAHLCRCTGWRSIVDAACGTEPRARHAADPVDSIRRATLEGGTPQRVGTEVVLGQAGFADDVAPDGCIVAVPDGAGGWALGETLAEARAAAQKRHGRRSGQALRWPVEVPPGEWDLTLQTTWVEPAYLELDASWCIPGGEPASPLANGGAFGGKVASLAPAAARELAKRTGRAVRVVLSREDVVRMGPKRPPAAGGVRADGTGVLRLAGQAAAPMPAGIRLEEVHVVGPPTSPSLRGAGWVEAAALVEAARALRESRVPPTLGPEGGEAAAGAARAGAAGAAGAGGAAVGAARAGAAVAGAAGEAAVTSPAGGRAEARVEVDGTGRPSSVFVEVACGQPLDEVVLRSYVVGAAHQALGMVCSEAIAVDEEGVPVDLTIRSFGVLRAREMPPVEVSVGAADGEATNGSDAAFAAVAAACWIALGLPARWPAWRSAP
jgi:xanthine dehydrogenase small subunit